MSKIYYGIQSLDGLCDIWGKWCAKHKVFDNEGNGINPEDVLFEHDLEDSNYNFNSVYMLLLGKVQTKTGLI